MGVVVAFVSQKGGVGKSTLARALARESAAGGLSVKVADLDVQQGTLVNWQRRRLAAGREPSVSVESFRNAESALNGRDSFDLLVLDGPARASSATLDIARSADLVVQPTGASLDDLEPAVLTFHELVKEGISREKLLFALCRMQTEAEVRDCRSTGTGEAVSRSESSGESVSVSTHRSVTGDPETAPERSRERQAPAGAERGAGGYRLIPPEQFTVDEQVLLKQELGRLAGEPPIINPAGMIVGENSRKVYLALEVRPELLTPCVRDLIRDRR